ILLLSINFVFSLDNTTEKNVSNKIIINYSVWEEWLYVDVFKLFPNIDENGNLQYTRIRIKDLMAGGFVLFSIGLIIWIIKKLQ
ncbi:hypothetical protein KKG81_00240, partial [bacterium]|nr:hypothetical protein [bacterium]